MHEYFDTATTAAKTIKFKSAVQVQYSSAMDAVQMRLFVILCVFSWWPITHGIVTLRPRNERVAFSSGVECLHRVQQVFHDLKAVLEDTEEGSNYTSGPYTKNVIMLHVHNLSSPAAEIERNYLKLLNQLISSGEMHRLIDKINSHAYL